MAGLAVLAGLEGSASPSPPPGFLGDFEWSSDMKLFGGFSGIEVAANGRDFIALSDRAALTQGRISRDADGRIVAVSTGPMQRLKGKGDDLLQGARADSEGIALAPDGSLYISFEAVARVLHYKSIGSSAENLPDHPDFAQLQNNSSLEALAIDAKGALYTLPERSGNRDRPFPVYRFSKGKWDKELSIPREGGFRPVGADFGPDGRFYLLERDFRGLSGFSSRLRRFDLGSKGFSNETTLFESATGLFDNLEGVSIWRDSKGRLTATMVSDNNMTVFLRTEIVEFRLPD